MPIPKTENKKLALMKKPILTPKLAKKIQDEIFKKMTSEKKIKLTCDFFRFGKKLNQLNDRKINGNRGPSYKNS